MHAIICTTVHAVCSMSFSSAPSDDEGKHRLPAPWVHITHL